jgi:hypothetical protein
MSLSFVLALLVIAAIALAWGAVAVWRRGDRAKAALMLALAVICAGNAAIWLLPDSSGEAPLGRELQ